eukprot:gene6562-7862_t
MSILQNAISAFVGQAACVCLQYTVLGRVLQAATRALRRQDYGMDHGTVVAELLPQGFDRYEDFRGAVLRSRPLLAPSMAAAIDGTVEEAAEESGEGNLVAVSDGSSVGGSSSAAGIKLVKLLQEQHAQLTTANQRLQEEGLTAKLWGARRGRNALQLALASVDTLREQGLPIPPSTDRAVMEVVDEQSGQ